MSNTKYELQILKNIQRKIENGKLNYTQITALINFLLNKLLTPDENFDETVKTIKLLKDEKQMYFAKKGRKFYHKQWFFRLVEAIYSFKIGEVDEFDIWIDMAE